ncbi:MAG: hypothetical protein ACRBN8_11540 [Nannocystales bacterium]
MSRSFLALAPWSLGFVLGCSPGPEPAQVPASAPALPEPPPPPPHGLPIVSLEVDWTPPRQVAGDLAGLRKALRSSSAMGVARVQRRLDVGSQLPRALATLAPHTAWTIEPSAWDASVEGRLPLTRQPAPVGTPPTYASGGVSLGGTADRTVLVVGDADLDVRAWRALPAAWSGSCQPIYDALALSQEQSLAYAEPFLDHADTVLRLNFRAGLADVLPDLRTALEPYASPEPPAEATSDERQTHACGRAQYLRVEAAATCLQGNRCEAGPRVVLRGGVAVAMSAPQWAPDDCEERIETDVEAVLTTAATKATVATVSQLEPQWVTLVDRVGAMGAVYEALEDLCSPRRRRFADEDLVDARARLGRVERALGSDALDESGRWDVDVGSMFVPGAGPVTTLARFVPAEGGGAQTAVAEAKGVRRFLLSRSLCRSGYGDLPLAVAVFDPDQAEAKHFTYVYEETLFCADLALPLPAATAD